MIKCRNNEIIKLLKSEDCFGAFNMRLSCKMHDDCFSLVCCLQGSYIALYSSAEVLSRFLHNCAMFLTCSADLWKQWIAQQMLGSLGQDPISLDLWILCQVRKFSLIGIPGLVGLPLE